VTQGRIITVGSVPVAAIVVAAVLAFTGRDEPAPRPPKPTLAVAPSGKASGAMPGKVFGTIQNAQQVADEATENVRTPYGVQADLQPLPASAFKAPVARYRAYSIRQARALAGDVRALRAALGRGDRAGAERAWASAYDHYLLIGAAYGALGELDQAIDGTPGGLPGGPRDPRFTGLHRVEHLLWTGAPLAAVRPWARRLAADVAKLPRALGKVRIDPLTYATRAHEILEDAQRDMLSGRAAPWSGAGVEATADGLQATNTVLRTLRGVLAGRGDVLPQVDGRLAQLGKELAALRRAHGGRLPTLQQLRPREREQLDGALGASLEVLAGVPGALETQLPPVVPKLPGVKK
jgi:iron uptake system EfeUOB component EfeO/EfeM